MLAPALALHEAVFSERQQTGYETRLIYFTEKEEGTAPGNGRGEGHLTEDKAICTSTVVPSSVPANVCGRLRTHKVAR